MKERERKDIKVICVLLVFVVGLFCASFVSAADEKVTLRWFMTPYGDPETHSGLLDVFDEIERELGIKVVYEMVPFPQFNDKQLSMIMAHDTPDFGWVNMMVATPLFRAGYFEPLDDYFAKSTVLKKEDFLPGPWDNMVVDGVTYGVPFESDCRLLYYNADLFQDAGIGLPPELDMRTIGWDGFIDLCKKLTKDADGDGIADVYGFTFVGGEHNHFMHDAADFWHQIDGNLVNKDATKATCNQEPFVRTIQFYRDLVVAGVVPPGFLSYQGYPDCEAQFAQGKVATWVTGPWEVPELRRLNPELNFSVTHLPLAKDGHLASSGGGWHAIIYKDSKHKEEAWKALEYLMTHFIPVSMPCYKRTQRVGPWSDPIYDIFFEYLPVTKSPTPPFPMLDEAWKTAFVEIQNALIGNKPVQQAMDDAARKIDALLLSQ